LVVPLRSTTGGMDSTFLVTLRGRRTIARACLNTVDLPL
jgi:hypothetical protein